MSASALSTSATSLLLALFETVPHVMVCVKDRSGCYTAANDAFVHRTNRRRVADVLGRRAGDLFPGDLAASYEAQDESVFHTGRSVRNQLEVITDRAGRPSWFLTTKLLVAEVAEIVVVSVPAHLASPGEASGLLAAIEFVHDEIAKPITVREVAKHAGVSIDAIERAVRRVLGTSPKQLILRTRVEHAATLLSTTSAPLADVAAASGYYDQSQFTRQFKAVTGTTPGEYRSLGLGVL